MRRLAVVAALGLAAGALRAQDAADPAEAARARQARINELRHELSSSKEADRLAAIKALGEIDDGDARSLLIKKMVSDSEAVRKAAAKAIILHRKPICAQALGNAIQANAQDEKLVKFFIEALAELDMCASIRILTAVLQGAPALGDDVLKAIVRIGCPEAVPPLVAYLKTAETEEKKPDFFDNSGLGGGGFGGLGGGRNRGNQGGGRVENKSKDKTVAALAQKIRDALSKLTGQKYGSQREWSAAASSGALAAKMVSVYHCEDAGKTYELPAASSNKCPHSTRSSHEDTFLKHRRED